MSLKKILFVASAVGMCPVSAMAQTLEFGATVGRASVNDRIAGDNFTSGPVLLDSSAKLAVPALPTTGDPPALAATSHNQQDFELKLSGLATLTLSNESVFFVQGQLTGAVFGVDAGAGIVDLDTGNTGNTGNAGYTAVFENQVRVTDDDTTDGGDGESQFRVKVTLTAAADSDPLSSLGVNLPIRFAGCPRDAAGASVQIELLAATAAGEPGTSVYSSGAFALIECFADLLIIQVASDVGTGDSQLSLGDRMRFVAGVDGPPDLNSDGDIVVDIGRADTETQATVGVVTLTRNAPPAGSVVLTSLGSSAASEKLDNMGDFIGMSVELTLSGADSMADLRQIRAGFGTPGTIPASSNFAYSGAATSGASATATITYPLRVLENVIFSSVPFKQGIVVDLSSVGNAEETLLSTFISAADVTVTYANGRDSKSILTGESESEGLDTLDPQLATCGEFDRIGDSSQPYATRIRVTGHAGTSKIVGYMRNSSAGLAATTADLTVDTLTGNSITITEEHLAASSAFGAFGDADFILGFQDLTNPDSLDCDRLLIFGDRNNLLVPFGNDRIDVSNQARNDGDD